MSRKPIKFKYAKEFFPLDVVCEAVDVKILESKFAELEKQIDKAVEVIRKINDIGEEKTQELSSGRIISAFCIASEFLKSIEQEHE